MNDTVFYANVHDSKYPRNRLIREMLEGDGAFRVIMSQKVESASMIGKTLINAQRIFKLSGGNRIIVLSEFSLRYAPYTWLLSRLTGAVHVVDGFVRLYETRVEDLGEVRPTSWKALAYKAIDWFSVRFSDIYLVDTRVRAKKIQQSIKLRPAVYSLPVGAPSWAKSRSRRNTHPGVRLLYYGNYIHLHGVETVVRAFARLDPSLGATLTLLGDGKLKSGIETLVSELGLGESCEFRPPVVEELLPEVIADHDIVLGIFGGSPKAGSVIANKVWQGLACGRVLVTRESEALEELRPLVGAQLKTCAPADDRALAEVLTEVISTQQHLDDFAETSQKLDDYVREEFRGFLQQLSRTRPRGLFPMASKNARKEAHD